MKVLKKHLILILGFIAILSIAEVYLSYKYSWSIVGDNGKRLMDMGEHSAFSAFYQSMGGFSFFVMAFLPYFLLTNNVTSNLFVQAKHTKFDFFIITRYGSFKKYKREITKKVFVTSFLLNLFFVGVIWLGTLLEFGKYPLFHMTADELNSSLYIPLVPNSWLACLLYFLTSSIGAALFSLLLLALSWKKVNPLVFRGGGLVVGVAAHVIPTLLGKTTFNFSAAHLITPGLVVPSFSVSTMYFSLFAFFTAFLFYGMIATLLLKFNMKESC